MMKIVTVASAKGGVGKSTFCCSVGKLLALHGQRVLLVDMDIGVRSLDILLGVAEKTVYNWGDIIKGNCEYRKAVTEVSNGLFLMAAPIDFSEDYTVDSFREMLLSFEKDFDYVLLDSPAGLESGFRLCGGVSDCCVVMSTPDQVSIRAATYAAQNMREMGIKSIRLVINKFNKKLHKKIDVDAFIDTVGARFLGVIPESEEVYRFVNGEKIPYKSKGNQAFLRISQRLAGENVPFRVKNL